jgi:hypothetical protein
MNGTTFDRYVIAPSDQELVDRYKDKKFEGVPPALQCATLGAFGGFFYRGFRAHDYALGRRNCQKFLQDCRCSSTRSPAAARKCKTSCSP